MQGDFAAETVYDDDPVRVALSFADAGAPWLHVVDLDAARTGVTTNLAVLEALCGAVSCPVQSGGGVRDVGTAARLFEAGVARVVIGTAAVEEPALVAELAGRFPGRIAVGLDARGREVAVRGWQAGSGVDLVDLAVRFSDVGVAALIVTEIGRDGTMAGPDLVQLASVLEASAIPVIASGGVGSLDDLRVLSHLDVDGRTLHGAIAGRALYENRFTVAEALAVLSTTPEM